MLVAVFAPGFGSHAIAQSSGASPARPASACNGDAPPTPGVLSPVSGEDLTWKSQQAAPARPVRLAGLQIAQEPLLAAAVLARLGEWNGPGLAMIPVGQPDRWGRTPVLLQLDGRLLNEVLLQEGLARFRPGDLSASCFRRFVAAEAQARRARRGGWGMAGNAPAFAILDAADASGWGEAIGRFVLVEGRVASVGETRSRIFLNFGEVRSEDFTIVIQKRNLRNVEASGMRLTSLEGRRIRVRGTLVESGGPLVEVKSPEAIERLD